MDCGKCSQPIRLSKVSHKGVFYHNGCFSCDGCKRSLKGVPEDGIHKLQSCFYHTECYKQLEEDMCSKCGKLITDGGLEHNGKSYHDDCFVCSKCNQSLSGKQFHLEDGVFYDTQCFRKLNAMECDQCHDLIEGVDIKYITYKFIHHRCFFCTECRKQLSTAEKFRDVKTTVKGALICLPCSQIDPSTNRKTSVTNYIRKF
ncbi:four and a half LIM domains protein 3-like [Hydractinia symbiolongicarpus]|uniref:four and a half LIM domains protein 3-like n=1 Tax=Hydractinia symbiolongicarpus TaxID=13093 RepID=UPI00254E8710|nr:four and a half LIM domains protein 3-like [Hydractinia symbiolongicarpus]